MVRSAQKRTHLLEKIQALPPEKIAEIEDFVDFLQQRSEEQKLRSTINRASEKRLKKVWDNADDAEYDRLEIRRCRTRSIPVYKPI